MARMGRDSNLYFFSCKKEVQVVFYLATETKGEFCQIEYANF